MLHCCADVLLVNVNQAEDGHTQQVAIFHYSLLVAFGFWQHCCFLSASDCCPLPWPGRFIHVPGVRMWEVRKVAGWEAEVNSMCACVLYNTLSPSVFWLARCLLHQKKYLFFFFFAFFNSTYTHVAAHMKAPDLKATLLSELTPKNIWMQHCCHRKHRWFSIHLGYEPHNIHIKTIFFRLWCFIKNLPKDKNILIILFIMFSCYTIIKVNIFILN